jgi:hypothetical protein
MKKTWEGINEILYRRRKVFKTISSLKDLNNNGKVIKEASQIPHIINQHFATVGSKLASKLPSSHHHYLDYVNKCKSPASSFYHQPVLPEDINLEILSIPNNKSYGLYSSPTKGRTIIFLEGRDGHFVNANNFFWCCRCKQWV